MSVVQDRALRNEASWSICITPGCCLIWLVGRGQVWGDIMKAGPTSLRILYARLHKGTK